MPKEKIVMPILYNYKVIAIASALKNYRVTFFINDALQINLKSVDELTIDNKKDGKVFEYEKYEDIETDIDFEYLLFNNKTIGKQLLPSLKGFDYILIIKSENDITFQEEAYRKLKEIQEFKIVFKVLKLSPRDNSIVEKQIIYR